jgi:hypothetical protein
MVLKSFWTGMTYGPPLEGLVDLTCRNTKIVLGEKVLWMIEVDVSGCERDYILKLQFQSELADYVGLCDVADSVPQSRMAGILVYAREISLGMRVESVQRNF